MATENNNLPSVALQDAGFIVITFPPNGHITLDEVQRLLTLHRELAPDKQSPVLWLCDSVTKVDHEVQLYASSAEVLELVGAGAVVVKSFLARQLAKRFVWHHKPPYPFRVFEDRHKAEAWLLQAASGRAAG